MTLGRRDFLQRLSAALAALGLTDTALANYSTTYQRAIADSNRCLALLVGINLYPPDTWEIAPTVHKDSFLEGSLTDIELQRELLINRFGVIPRDIVTLGNENATVNQILETFQGHLIDQAKPGDTVVFHFSGLGSQAQVTGQPEGALPTLVAADSHLPSSETPVIRDLFEESLCQLLSGLRGVKLLTVIDASIAAHPVTRRGNFRVRSRPTIPTGDWQAPFDPRFKQPRKTWQQLATTWPGFLLHAQSGGSIALEGTWEGFSAGLFTYALTQQIWTSLPSQRQQWFIHRIDRKLSAWTGSDQAYQVYGKQSGDRQELPLISGTLPKPAADGVVKTVDTVNRSAIVWLGGLPTALLPYCDLGLRLQPLPALPGLAAIPAGTLTVKTVNGLRAKATLTDQEGLPVGAPVIEVERRFPKEINLTIALDPTLERIERVDATSALSGTPYITTTAPGEQAADCLFGKATNILAFKVPPQQREPEAADATSSPTPTPKPETGPPGYGLFTPDGSLISGTTAESGEAVKTAVSRLQGTLRSLLAVKMLRLTANPISSRLPVRLTLETQEPKRQLLLAEETLRSRQLNRANLSTTETSGFDKVPQNRAEQYQIRLLNSGSNPLYFLLVTIVEKSQLSLYCPPLDVSEGSEQSSKTIAANSELPAGATVQFPQMPDSTFSLQPLQTTEIFAIASVQPFTNVWRTVRTPEFRYQSDRWSTIPDPLPVAQAIFQDLNNASHPSKESASSSEVGWSFKSDAWATLSL